MITNAVLHTLGSLLLFIALCQLTGATWRSAFVAGVFALHPLHVESVAWAAERNDVLCGVFSMLTLIAYAAYAKHPGSTARYALVVVSFTAALLAKPMAVTLPFVLLLLDFWPLERLRADRVRSLVVEKVPMFVIAAAASITVLFTQRSERAMSFGEDLPFSYRFLNGMESYVIYIADSLWPNKLGAFYPHPMEQLAFGPAIAAGLLLIAITVLFLRFAQSRPYLPVGWLWFLGSLVPVIGLVQVGLQSRADRYMYFPLVGLSLIVAWGLPDLLGPSRRAKTVLAICGAIVIGSLTVATEFQIRHWRDSVVLYEQAIRVTRDNYEAHSRLGQTFEKRGRGREAVSNYREALRINPLIDSAANNLAWILATARDSKLRDPEDAVRVAEAPTQRIRPARPEMLDTLAASYAAAGRFEDAQRTVAQAAALAAGLPPLLAEIEEHAALYRQGRPLRID